MRITGQTGWKACQKREGVAEHLPLNVHTPRQGNPGREKIVMVATRAGEEGRRQLKQREQKPSKREMVSEDWTQKQKMKGVGRSGAN